MYRHKVDGNQAEVINVLKRHHVSVLNLSGCGVGGVPDLCCAVPGRTVLLEVKDVRGRGGRLTPCQERFHKEWQGECHVVFSAEQALSILGIKAGDE